MNTGTKIRTILIIATCLNTALMATDVTGFNNPVVDAVYSWLSIIANFVIVFCGAWFNNDFTVEACEATGEMRARKEDAKGDGLGEDFSDEAYEVFEVEEEGEE